MLVVLRAGKEKHQNLKENEKDRLTFSTCPMNIMSLPIPTRPSFPHLSDLLPLPISYKTAIAGILDQPPNIFPGRCCGCCCALLSAFPTPSSRFVTDEGNLGPCIWA